MKHTLKYAGSNTDCGHTDLKQKPLRAKKKSMKLLQLAFSRNHCALRISLLKNLLLAFSSMLCYTNSILVMFWRDCTRSYNLKVTVTVSEFGHLRRFCRLLYCVRLIYVFWFIIFSKTLDFWQFWKHWVLNNVRWWTEKTFVLFHFKKELIFSGGQFAKSSEAKCFFWEIFKANNCLRCLSHRQSALNSAVSGIWYLSALIQRTWWTSVLISVVSELIGLDFLWTSANQKLNNPGPPSSVSERINVV